MLALAVPGAAAAQTAHDDGGALTARVGAWALNDDVSVFGAVAAGLRFGNHVVIDLEYTAGFIPGVTCDASAGGCGDEDETLSMLTVGPRIELGSGRTRPYVAAFFGRLFETGDGTLGGRVGLRQELSARTAVLADVTHQIAGSGGSVGSITSFALGFTLELPD